MSKPPAQRDVPADALRFDAPLPLTFADVVEGETNRVPIVLNARTPDPIYHWYWGRVVHDMEGMFLRKPSALIDYCHMAAWDANEILGAATEFEADAKTGLTIKGEIFSTRADDRASDVISKGRGGVPFEASIDFNGPGVIAEEVGEGAKVEVNGYTFEGPGIVIRKWPLRSVAVCPYGADAGTRSAFSQRNARDEPQSVAVQFTEPIMPKNSTKPADDSQIGKENEQSNPTTPAGKVSGSGGESTASAATEGGEVITLNLQDVQQEFQQELRRFVGEFGPDNGAKWYSENKTFEEALGLHCAELKTQLAAKDKTLAEVNEKLASLDRGEADPVEFSDASGGQADERTRNLQQKLGSGLGRFAAGLKLPAKK